MKRFAIVCAMCLLLSLLLFMPATAENIARLTEEYGLDTEEAQVISDILDQMGEMTDEEINALLSRFFAGEQMQPGTLSEGRYSHTAGLSFPVPEGYEVLEDVPGTIFVLRGPSADSGFTPAISVAMYGEENAPYETITQEQLTAFFSETLPNYQFMQLDSFDYHGTVAYEHVSSHGESEDAQLIQYQMYFTLGGKTYVITMTTLAEEAVHDSALLVYDTFIMELTFDGATAETGQTQGETATPTKSPPASAGQGNG